jgi:glycosyltransferase involved in cell wall biosynthesis
VARPEKRSFNRISPITSLSVVMPVYNEAATVASALKEVLSSGRPSIRLEVIVVESNSTDGSREIVQQFEGADCLEVVYEELPQGKGHAVREGFRRATGDVIAIFDADGEYHFDDVWRLIEPIASGEAAFVLGSRHTTGTEMRQFSSKAWLGSAMNVMHVVFTSMLNIAFGTHLRDPFTMWKVFRRELLQEVTFSSNRFDLDWEIVGKFALIGAVPIEISASYESRDYDQGKKVRLIRDPLTWIRVVWKVRREANMFAKRN